MSIIEVVYFVYFIIYNTNIVLSYRVSNSRGYTCVCHSRNVFSRDECCWKELATVILFNAYALLRFSLPLIYFDFAFLLVYLSLVRLPLMFHFLIFPALVNFSSTRSELISRIFTISHFTVAYSVTWPMNGSEAAGCTDLAVFIM